MMDTFLAVHLISFLAWYSWIKTQDDLPTLEVAGSLVPQSNLGA